MAQAVGRSPERGSRAGAPTAPALRGGVAAGEPVPRFEMRAVRKAFGATVALSDVDFAVRPGEVCALVGQNGAGKSTLMGILAGALAPDAGSMMLDGSPYSPKNPLEARRAGVAMIYQELSLAPHLSVAENIALGVEPTGPFGFVYRNVARQRARDALQQLGHPDIPADARVGALSPAAQQLVEIARALATGCRVLVLDEPTSSLAHDDVRKLFELIKRLKQQGLAIVYISHFIDEVKQVSDRFVVLRDSCNAGEGITSGATAGEIVNLMVGRRIDDLYQRSARTAGESILEVNDLVPPRPAAAGATTFTLHRGEIVGIAGLLGAGRTTLLRTLFGLEPVRRGTVRLGIYTGRFSPAGAWREGMGLLSEDRTGEGLASGLSIADNITLTRLAGFGPGFFVVPSHQATAARRWIDRLGIRSTGPRQPVAHLSGGNQQKVAVARLLQHDVDVLVLDEPTRGIDVASKAQIYKLIDELVSGPPEGGLYGGEDRRKAVLLVSSYFPELLAVCDRIAVMSRGRLGPARPASEWTEHALLMEASGADAAS
jgi:ribose transport system ATP-binding protein